MQPYLKETADCSFLLSLYDFRNRILGILWSFKIGHLKQSIWMHMSMYCLLKGTVLMFLNLLLCYRLLATLTVIFH